MPVLPRLLPSADDAPPLFPAFLPSGRSRGPLVVQPRAQLDGGAGDLPARRSSHQGSSTSGTSSRPSDERWILRLPSAGRVGGSMGLGVGGGYFVSPAQPDPGCSTSRGNPADANFPCAAAGWNRGGEGRRGVAVRWETTR
jgi:hypothetical protein